MFLIRFILKFKVMKKNFLKSKSKKVLIAISQVLELDVNNLHKLPKYFLVQILAKVSYREIINAHKAVIA